MISETEVKQALTATGTGLRFNKGKLRLELIPPYPLEEISKIFTYGADKYTVKDENGKIIRRGDNNWKGGMSWMAVVASAKRHIEKFVDGEDRDEESGLLHLAHAATNLIFLLEYYKIFPQGDDRPHHYLKGLKIGLDIDEVLADFTGAWAEKFSVDRPVYWNYDREMLAKLKALPKEFWLGIKPKVDPKNMPFEPHCYITSRVIPTEWTEEWLDKMGFPAAPVYTVNHGQSKIEVAKKSGIDIFVDDRFENFVELNKAGICCFLMDAPHNTRYNVGYRRIKDLNELK